MANLSVFRANDKTFTLTLTNSSGTAIDITGDTIKFVVKATDDNAGAEVIAKEITSHTDPTAGKTEIVLTDTDTTVASADYFYEIRRISSASIDTTLAKGKFIVIENLTT